METDDAHLTNPEVKSEGCHAWGIPSVLHYFAGILLILFAVSHIAFLLTADYQGELPNPVFPFFSNNSLYLVAAFAEGCVALVCFRFHGREFTSVIILTFVALVALYRWGFYFLGGSHCNCLGLLGHLLHVTKKQETAIPWLVLAYLAMTTLPWLLALIRGRRGKTSSVTALLSRGIILCGVLAHFDGAAQDIEVFGKYDGSAQNPETGVSYKDNRQIHASFVAVAGEHSWRLIATNLDTGDVGQMWYDGTNSYVVEAESSHAGEPRTNVACVSRSPFYLGSYSGDYLDMSLPWITYCLSPRFLTTNKGNIVALPVPWLKPHMSPGAYAYGWIIHAVKGGKFIETASVVRDTTLDLPGDKVLFEPELAYPDTAGQYDALMSTRHFMGTISNGWVETDFEVTDFYQTNGVKIPAESQISHFMYSGGGGRAPFQYPLFVGHLTSTKIILHGDQDLPNTGPEQAVQVFDFRYHKLSNHRNFAFAEYGLASGDPWKTADDQSLLAEQEDYIQHGPRYDSFVTRKVNIVWILGGVILVSGIVLLLKNRGR